MSASGNEDYAELNLVDQQNTDPGIPRNIPCTRAVLRLGRVEHPDFADVGIKSAKFEPMVSRKHATIKKGRSTWHMIDNKSTNGVLINGTRIEAEVPQALKDGDVITFGTDQSDLVYTFEVNRRRAGCGQQEQADAEMHKLKLLADEGWYKKEDFENARAAILDRSAPSKWMAWDKTPRTTKDIKGITEKEARGPMEKAFKLAYNFRKRIWEKSITLITMEDKAFDSGAMRSCFKMTDWTQPEGQRQWVAKCSKDEDEPQQTYFVDCEMQSLCQYFAEEFNAKNPPKRVDFLDAFMIECIDRPGKPIFAIEPFMPGKYIKHNNNWGFVSQEDRNTPQAFSHFTYTHSSGFYLVCDIQGVGDRYTDPQVHSKDQQGFGRGNMGLQGINRFFATHECNSVCIHLGIDTNRKKKVMDVGTKPPPGWSANRGPSQPGRSLAGVGPYAITEEEMADMNLDRPQLDNITNKFKRYDNGTGFVHKADLVPLCRELEHKLEPSDINRVTLNAEGRLSFKNFLLWWRGV